MTLKPEFLPVGSIVEQKANDTTWLPTVIIADDLQLLESKPCLFNENFRPITLTPEILTEWCGFEKINSTWYRLGDLAINISGFTEWKGLHTGVICDYLHELQNLFLGFKTVLPIKIK